MEMSCVVVCGKMRQEEDMGEECELLSKIKGEFVSHQSVVF